MDFNALNQNEETTHMHLQNTTVAAGREKAPRQKMWRRLALVFGAAAAAGVALSCATSRTIFAPPDVPGAKFVGSASCADCHQEIVRDFKSSSHARLEARGDTVQNVGCESCHGPGSTHNDSGGAAHTIVNPNKSPETCYRCHLEMKARFSLPSHHPVEEGKVSCSDCHNPHKGPAVNGGGTELATEFDTCGRCHTAQRGPFVFEHEAIREGCTTCHQPHGTVNAKMLRERNASLCLKCHFQEQTVAGRVYIGARDHSSFLSRGTCWSAGCHEAIHGSQIGSSLRF
jgi:predicted CXXCH cytochrome family protein